MRVTDVQAPAALLLDSSLPASAKLIWLVARLPDRPTPAGPADLQARSGLSRPTILQGLRRLAEVGWYSATAGAFVERSSPGARVRIPGALLTERSIGAQGRVLYGALQLTPGFRSQTGSLTFAGLAKLVGISVPTARLAVRELTHAGWLQVSQANQLAPVRFSLRHPGESEVHRAQLHLKRAPHLGEALMREYLSLLVDSADFEDDAAPGFLVNPLTQLRLEFDRFYSAGVALEFNGPQHYGATDRFSDKDAAQQQARDLMKLGICATRGITLLVIRPEDLSLDTLRQKIEPHLPLRNLIGHEPLIEFLETVSRRYRLAARRGRHHGPGPVQ